VSAGTVAYGPKVIAGAILPAGGGDVPTERTAALMAVMHGAPVSTGFAAWALERFARRPIGAGFDDTMATALRAEVMLGADEAPTNMVGKRTGTHGAPTGNSPHAVAARISDARLAWYAPISSPPQVAIATLGRLEGYPGYPVRRAGDHLEPALLAELCRRYDHTIG
jgi:hypothetical protein